MGLTLYLCKTKDKSRIKEYFVTTVLSRWATETRHCITPLPGTDYVSGKTWKDVCQVLRREFAANVVMRQDAVWVFEWDIPDRGVVFFPGSLSEIQTSV